jgi:hypothetical protein
MARIAASARREAGPRVRLAIAPHAATRRGSPPASQPGPGDAGRAARPRGEPKSAVSRDGALLRVRADSTARRREAEMGGFVAGSSRSHRSAAWAGVGRAWELLVRGGSSAGSLTSVEGSEPLRLYVGRQCTGGEVRDR